MQLSKERIQEFKDLLEEKKGEKVSWEEATEGAHQLGRFAEIIYDAAKTDHFRKQKLKKYKKGFHLEGGPFNCFICHKGVSDKETWYTEDGITCLPCRDALRSGDLPHEAIRDRDSWYAGWEVCDELDIKHPTVRKMIRTGELKAKTVLDKDGKQYEQIFMVRDNPQMLPPKDFKEITLLLCSSGRFFTEEAQRLFKKPLKESKIAYIITAAKGVTDTTYMEERKKRMKELDFDYEEIDIEGQTEEKLSELLYYKDIIFVEGGNTFYLLKATRKSNFDQVLKRCLRRGALYVGASAGSYLVCPTIEMATWKHQDKYDHCGLTNLDALYLVPFLITAHYTDEYKKLIQEKVKDSTYPVKILTDKQALLVQNGEVFIAGDGKEIILKSSH